MGFAGASVQFQFRFKPKKKMVPRARIELALPKEPDFESGASTNSTTGAYIRVGGGIIAILVKRSSKKSLRWDILISRQKQNAFDPFLTAPQTPACHN